MQTKMVSSLVLVFLVTAGEKLMRTYGRTVLRVLLVGLLAATAMTALSVAQSAPVASGSFMLPFGAQWGRLNLNPGTYSFTVQRGANTYVVQLERGNRAVGFVLPAAFSSRESSQLDEASLLCVRRTGTCSVSALKMPQFGVLYFQAPQSLKAQVVQQPNLIERLPVLLAKK